MMYRALAALTLSAALAACATAPSAPASEGPAELAEDNPLPGLSHVPTGWRAPVLSWYAASAERAELTRVLRALELTDGLVLIFERQVGEGASCRSGLTRLSFTRSSAGVEFERLDAGLDCCAATPCTPGPDGWQLRWNQAAATGATADLAALVAPAGFELHALYPDAQVSAEARAHWTAEDLREGRVAVPGCDLVWATPSCGEADPSTGMWRCRCDAGGSHVVFSWMGGLDGPRLVHIRDESH
jgi:hypothetical protein